MRCGNFFATVANTSVAENVSAIVHETVVLESGEPHAISDTIQSEKYAPPK